jgi:membrane associated rhomboid family serine protease
MIINSRDDPRRHAICEYRNFPEHQKKNTMIRTMQQIFREWQRSRTSCQKEAGRTVLRYSAVVVLITGLLWLLQLFFYEGITAGSIDNIWAHHHLILNSSHYTLQSMFLSNYLHDHLSFEHIFMNSASFILFYLLLALAYYLRAVKNLSLPKSYFFWFFVFCLLCVPFITSLTTLQFPGIIRDSVGFSGIVFALIGALAGISLYPLYFSLKNRVWNRSEYTADEQEAFICRIIYWGWCLLLFACYFYGNFAFSASNVNQIAHASGAVAGLVFTLLFETAVKKR